MARSPPRRDASAAGLRRPLSSLTKGGLIGYGPDLLDMYRRVVGHVYRILKGARPANLPVQRPATFELAISERTAKALALTIPAILLGRLGRLDRLIR